MKILVVDACTSDNSRTRALTKYLLTKLNGDIQTVYLTENKPGALDKKTLSKRDNAVKNNDFSDKMFDFAKQFKSTDTVIFAAPYWDLSFPSVLKQYIEQINVCGLTFEYTRSGMPKSLSNVKRFIYVTTAGGYIVSDELGYGYIKNVMQLFYEVSDSAYIKAEGLDIYGNNVGEILKKAKTDIDNISGCR